MRRCLHNNNVTSTLKAWIDHVFNHPVNKAAWYWSDNAEQWAGPREQIPLLIAETFERGGEVLAGFSDEQLSQGFWYVLGSTRLEFTDTLVDESIPLEVRSRALRSCVPLFEQIMMTRCTNHLCDDHGIGPLNLACYMWWDLVRFGRWKDRPDVLPEIVATLRNLIAIPHDACRESALHGLGHLCWDCSDYKPQVARIIDQFLTETPGLRPELLAYAEQARQGNVL